MVKLINVNSKALHLLLFIIIVQHKSPKKKPNEIKLKKKSVRKNPEFIYSLHYYLITTNYPKNIPVNTDNGCKTCPERNGGGYGGNFDGSGPLDTEEGGEIIEVSKSQKTHLYTI